MPVKKKVSDSPKISSLADKDDQQFIPTGVKELDEILGGGVGRGRITELWGEQSVGKTHLVTMLMANLSKEYKVLFIDVEFALNKDRVKELGADPQNIQYVADSHLENVCELMVREVGNYDVIILDSLAFLTPLTVSTGQVGDNAIGLYSRLIKHWVVKFRPQLGRSKTAFVAINQLRKAIGLYVKVEPPGGTAWYHAVDVRVRLETNSTDKIVEKGIRVGHYVRASTTKNKLAKPYQTAKFKVMY